MFVTSESLSGLDLHINVINSINSMVFKIHFLPYLGTTFCSLKHVLHTST